MQTYNQSKEIYPFTTLFVYKFALTTREYLNNIISSTLALFARMINWIYPKLYHNTRIYLFISFVENI